MVRLALPVVLIAGGVISRIVKVDVVLSEFPQLSDAVKVTVICLIFFPSQLSSTQTAVAELSLQVTAPPPRSVATAPPCLVSQPEYSVLLPPPSHSTVRLTAGVVICRLQQARISTSLVSLSTRGETARLSVAVSVTDKSSIVWLKLTFTSAEVSDPLTML